MTRKECEAILKEMRQIIKHFGYVTLADYYDLVGIDCRYTDNEKGWYSLQGFIIQNKYDAWFEIVLPEPVEIQTLELDA